MHVMSRGRLRVSVLAEPFVAQNRCAVVPRWVPTLAVGLVWLLSCKGYIIRIPLRILRYLVSCTECVV